MKNILDNLEKGQIFKLIPKNIEFAAKSLLKDIDEKTFTLELIGNNEPGYVKDETVEAFTTTIEGLLYFESVVESVNKKLVTIAIPPKHRYLQRREYTRVLINESVKLNNRYEAKIEDVSAGGMKLSSNVQLSMSESYNLMFPTDKRTFLQIEFQPIRIDLNSENKSSIQEYTISGRFKNLKNIDRISLVQFCFKKQIENENK